MLGLRERLDLSERLESRRLVGDGAMGTLLADRGVEYPLDKPSSPIRGSSGPARTIPARGRRYPVVVAREFYAAILDRVEAQGYDVFARRAETSLASKLRVAAMCAASDPGEWTARLREVRLKGDVAIPH